MSAYRKKTKNFEFNLLNDKSLSVSVPINCPVLTENFSGTSPGFTFFKGDKGVTFKLVIHNYLDGMKSHAAGLVVQTVLSAFAHTFEKNGDQRQQLLEGLRYFSFAEHYKVLHSNNGETLAKLRKVYDEIVEKAPIFEKEYNELVERARLLHLQEPFISSTGLMVYASRDAVWLAYETEEQASDSPEYLYSVDHRKGRVMYSDVYKGRQRECINYILHAQKLLYGLSFDEVQKKRMEKESIDKTRTELEIVLDIPTAHRREYIEQQAMQRVVTEAAIDENLTQLEQYGRLSK